jgi:hypothetical protein
MSEAIVKGLINNIFNNVVNEKAKENKSKKYGSEEICLICHEPLIDDLVYRFCCNKRYHEECLVSYVALNQYAKCPICRKWVKRDIKDSCDIIYREYQLRHARKKLKLATDYTDEVSYFSRTNQDVPGSGTQTGDSPDNPIYVSEDDIFTHVDNLLDLDMPTPPVAAIIPTPVRGRLRNVIRDQRNQVSMMQRVFDESWNNFFRES